MATIFKFSGTHKFLSNFYLNGPFEYLGKRWLTSEHAYQAMKTLDEDEREYIRSLRQPWMAKRAGSRYGINGRVITLRPDWKAVCYDTMLEIKRAQFEQNPGMCASLFTTMPSKLVEGNMWHDNFWGDCSCIQCIRIKGLNLYGKILMKLRDEIALQAFNNLPVRLTSRA